MKRDYANQATSSTSRKKPAGRPATRKPRARKDTRGTAKRQLTVSGVTFNAPSFSAGLILGGAAVLLLPQVLPRFEQSPDNTGNAEEQSQQQLVFSYDTLLSDNEVEIDESAYEVEFEDPNGDPNRTYLLQAASFHSFAEAANLQARLAEQGLPASVSRVTVKDKPWYRVTVGPFHRKVEAQRAVKELRENNLAPMHLKRG
jgi:hypothetical protein